MLMNCFSLFFLISHLNNRSCIFPLFNGNINRVHHPGHGLFFPRRGCRAEMINHRRVTRFAEWHDGMWPTSDGGRSAGFLKAK